MKVPRADEASRVGFRGTSCSWPWCDNPRGSARARHGLDGSRMRWRRSGTASGCPESHPLKGCDNRNRLRPGSRPCSCKCVSCNCWMKRRPGKSPGFDPWCDGNPRPSARVAAGECVARRTLRRRPRSIHPLCRTARARTKVRVGPRVAVPGWVWSDNRSASGPRANGAASVSCSGTGGIRTRDLSIQVDNLRPSARPGTPDEWMAGGSALYQAELRSHVLHLLRTAETGSPAGVEPAASGLAITLRHRPAAAAAGKRCSGRNFPALCH